MFDGWLDKISNFFVDLVKDALDALFTLLMDFMLWCLEAVLEAIKVLLYLIPEPCCVSVNWIGNALANLPPYALYVISMLPIEQAFVLIACGVSFYMLRKLVTLGQW